MQDRERLSAELQDNMTAIGRHLDEIKDLKTQHDMLVRSNAATRVRLSVSSCSWNSVRARSSPRLVPHCHTIRILTRFRTPTPVCELVTRSSQAGLLSAMS